MSKLTAARAAATSGPLDDPASSLTEIERVRMARQKTAILISQGEEWMIPYLRRFNSELVRLEEEQDLLRQAIALADAAHLRAA